MCSDIPDDNVYYLTTFYNKRVKCGEIFYGTEDDYYMAGQQRFGCDSIVSCCKDDDCLNLKVIDAGPNEFGEDNGNKQVIDASRSACKYFTG